MPQRAAPLLPLLPLLLAACATPAAVTQAGGGAPSAGAPGGREVQVELVVRYADNAIGGDPVRLRSYNGGLVGPTIRARPGDTLNIHLVNQLPPNPPAPPRGTNVPHHFNTTNLHTHGLHVSPSGNGDNVLLAIGPGEDFHYEIKIPADHPPGTFWYHPHVHGSTALQVASGMQGALIIEGDIDQVPAIAAAREQVLVLQQLPYARSDDPATGERKGTLEHFHRAFLNGAWERGGWRTLINGALEPVFELRPGEVQRWRFIDAGAEEELHVKIAGPGGRAVPLHLIAMDGITTGRIEPLDTLDLYPGYRADVLVRAPDQEGEYLVVDQEPPSGLTRLLGAKEPKTLARLKVSGPRREMALPQAAELAPLAPYRSIADEELTGKQEVRFGLMKVGEPPYPFAVNDKSFDPAAPARRLTLGDVEEWTITSEALGAHIFHIHTNPFEVIEPDGRRYWKDTLFVRGGQRYRATLRTRYRRYVGTFVLHCHILPHEDLGMMELVEIAPRTAGHHRH